MHAIENPKPTDDFGVLAVHTVENPEPTDDFGVLPVVHNLQFCANWVRHQLFRFEVDLSADEAEGNCKKGQRRPSARHS